MGNAIRFYSRSAQKTRENAQKTALKVVDLKPKSATALEYVLVADQMFSEDCALLGRDVGYRSIHFNPNRDMHQIPQAAYFIINELTEYKFFLWLSGLNLAICWGVPTVWIHSQLHPQKWSTQFDNIFVGDFADIEIWRVLSGWQSSNSVL